MARRFALTTLTLSLLAALPSSCDLSFASAEMHSRWEIADFGITIFAVGSSFEGELVMFQERNSNQPNKSFAGATKLSKGIYEAETNCLLFPMNSMRMVQTISPDKMRGSQEKYLEFPLNKVEGNSVPVRWFKGSARALKTRQFKRRK